MIKSPSSTIKSRSSTIKSLSSTIKSPRFDDQVSEFNNQLSEFNDQDSEFDDQDSEFNDQDSEFDRDDFGFDHQDFEVERGAADPYERERVGSRITYHSPQPLAYTRPRMKERFVVEGGRRLEGTIRPGGNKNAALPILAACLLTDKPSVLRNLPDIEDVRV